MTFSYPLPNARGRYGEYGGRYVPETLIPALDELTTAYKEAQNDPAFRQLFEHYLKTFVGRPSTLYYAENLTRHAGGAKIYLKREDLNHTGDRNRLERTRKIVAGKRRLSRC